MYGTQGAAAYGVANIVCALAMGLIVLCFAEAGSRVALTGGPYAYVEVAFGPFVGFLGGVLLWVLGTFAFAAVSTVFLDAAGALVPMFAGAVPRALLLALVLACTAGVNMRGVRQGTAVNVALTAWLPAGVASVSSSRTAASVVLARLLGCTGCRSSPPRTRLPSA